MHLPSAEREAIMSYGMLFRDKNPLLEVGENFDEAAFNKLLP
jgi:hypothetical protein